VSDKATLGFQPYLDGHYDASTQLQLHVYRRSEAAFDRWSEGERAWRLLREGIGLFAPDGSLNTRARAEAVVAAVLPQLQGPEWAKARRALARPCSRARSFFVWEIDSKTKA